MNRRTFLLFPAAFAPQWSFSPLELHGDYQTALDGIEYFFLGNGKILAAVQCVERAEAGTQAGIVLMPPNGSEGSILPSFTPSARACDIHALRY